MAFATRSHRISSGSDRVYIRSNFANNPTTYSVMQGTTVVEDGITSYTTARERMAELTVHRATTKANGKKRTRTVFPSAEIPHLWMHKATSYGKNANGSFYFDGDTIYSYGSHFPIARHVENATGQPAILFTTAEYSVTTTAHKSAVRSAIPESVPVFTVPTVQTRWGNFGESQHAANVTAYREKVSDLIVSAARARSSHNIEWSLKGAQRIADECLAYCAFFGLPVPELETVPSPDSDRLAAIRQRERGKATEKAAAEKARQEKERQELAVYREEWLNGAGTLGRWANVFPTALRIKGEDVQTSRGATFPARHAKRGLALVRAVMAQGTGWHRNGETCRLGHYQIDRITADGTVYAGCHVVPFESIERIAEDLQNMTTTTTTDEEN